MPGALTGRLYVQRVQVVRYEADGWGIGEIVHDGSRLLYHDHPRPRPETAAKLPQGMPEIPVITLSTNSVRVGNDFVSRFAALLGGYFAGERIDFSGVPIDLDWCTPFQLSLVTAARAVPRGETITYGELAALAGRPNAARAAGTFCAQNRFALIVPCHRVVSAAGLGSYGSLGLQYKRRLLALEGAHVPV
jgi:methylated-DNA-[protein]-cysteine S-methyltransferase